MSVLTSHLAAHEGIADAVAEGLARVAELFDRQLASDLGPVRDLCAHVERYRGKMLRPTLVILSGLAAGGGGRPVELTHAHTVVAATVEMVHMATLVHDDVLDEADLRRKSPTINRLHGNEPAVLLGDYLIASAYQLCATLPTPGPASAIGRAAMITASGELLQLHHRGNLDLDEPTYHEIIRGKTAELIATSCELGAWASGAPRETCEALSRFGHAVGSAFQIQDDLLDLTGAEAAVGKSVGKDLEKGKLTLPVIHHLAALSAEARERSRGLLRTLTTNEASSHDAVLLARLAGLLESTGSIGYARAMARTMVEAAKGELAALAQTPARAALSALADAVVDRET